MEDRKKVCFKSAIKTLASPHLCFSQAVENSCPLNHNVPRWTWATKLKLSHSVSHLHCYWLTLPITCCQLLLSPLQHLLSVEIQWSQQTGFPTGPPGIQYQHCNFCASATNRSVIIFTNFVTDELWLRVTDRRWCLLHRNLRDRFVQWRSTLWLLKRVHIQTAADQYQWRTSKSCKKTVSMFSLHTELRGVHLPLVQDLWGHCGYKRSTELNSAGFAKGHPTGMKSAGYDEIQWKPKHIYWMCLSTIAVSMWKWRWLGMWSLLYTCFKTCTAWLHSEIPYLNSKQGSSKGINYFFLFHLHTHKFVKILPATFIICMETDLFLRVIIPTYKKRF